MSQRLNSYFSGNPELREIARKAGRLAALDRCYRAAIPETLAKASRVIGLERQNLVLGADNGAVAAKLRQLAPAILHHIKENYQEVTGIQVKVQVSQPTPSRGRTPLKLSTEGRAQLSDLASNLRESTLKSAVLRLIKR